MTSRTTARKTGNARKTTRAANPVRKAMRTASSATVAAADDLSSLLLRFPAKTIALTKQCLLKLRKALPGTNLLVYEYADSLVVSFSMSEHGCEGIVTLKVLPQEARLYVDKSVPDPNHLLQGTGGKVRSVAITTASELDRGDVHTLIKAAIKHSGVALPRGGSNRVLLKSALMAKSR